MEQHEKSAQQPIFHILLYTCGWISGLWSTYHLFTYSRRYFVGLTTFDIGLLGIALITGLTLSWIWRIQPKRGIIFGAIITSITSYISLLTFPIMISPTEMPIREVFGIVESQQGMLSIVFLLLGSSLLFSGIIQFWTKSTLYHPNRESERTINQLEMLLGIILGIGIYIILLYAFPNNLNNIFFVNAISSSILLLICGIIPNILFSEKISSVTTIFKTKDLRYSTKLIRSLSMELTWLIHTALLVAISYLYNLLSNNVEHISYIIGLFINIAIGASILLLLLVNKKISGFIPSILLFAGIVALSGIINIGLNLEEMTFFNIPTAIALIFILWNYLNQVQKYSKAQIRGVSLIITFVLMGYAGFIPAYSDEILRMSELLEWLIWLLFLLEIGLEIIRYRITPDIFQIKEYVTRTIPALNKNKIESGNLEEIANE